MDYSGMIFISVFLFCRNVVNRILGMTCNQHINLISMNTKLEWTRWFAFACLLVFLCALVCFRVLYCSERAFPVALISSTKYFFPFFLCIILKLLFFKIWTGKTFSLLGRLRRWISGWHGGNLTEFDGFVFFVVDGTSDAPGRKHYTINRRPCIPSTWNCESLDETFGRFCETCWIWTTLSHHWQS